MQLAECQEIILAVEAGVLSITLNRPHKRNAMNTRLVEELMAVFSSIADDRSIRAVVIRGADGHFCAGADISGLNKQAQTESEAAQASWDFNRQFGRMITQVNQAPQVVITVLEGAVMGGGFGLACVSDIAITDGKAKFALPETGLGIIPAQIAPFVVARIGLTQARRLALLGEKINGQQAYGLGICHYLTDSSKAMDERLEDVLQKIKRCAPNATAVTKQLLLQVGQVELDQLLDSAADQFCVAMNSDEGQEGTQAFIQKRLPSWAQ